MIEGFNTTNESHPINENMNMVQTFELSEVSVGRRFFWQIAGYEVHGQVLLMSCKLSVV